MEVEGLGGSDGGAPGRRLEEEPATAAAISAPIAAAPMNINPVVTASFEGRVHSTRTPFARAKSAARSTDCRNRLAGWPRKKDMTDIPDYYVLLGIEQTAAPNAIKRAYKAALLKHHPDRNGDRVDADEVTRRLIEARDTLLDPVRRADYDRLWSEARRWSRTTARKTSAQEEEVPPREHRESASQSGDTNTSDQSGGEGRAKGSDWSGWIVAGLGFLGLGAAIVLAANHNEYDRMTRRYRDRNGRFRGGPFF